MNPQDLNNWVPARELPALTNGKVTNTAAKKLLQHRATNGLEARGGARVVGRQGYLNVPVVLDFLFGEKEGV